MAILGHAASAEDGSGFGMPGDQTGREVRMETLGADGNKWVYGYRYPNTEVADRIGEAFRQACMNAMVGYSRETYTGWGLYHTRYGLWEAIHETGDIRKIDKPVNCDCSQLAISACLIAGVPGAEQYRSMVTAIEDQVLTALGFERYDYDITKTKKGDLLWRSGHTGGVVEGYEGTTPEPTIKYRGRITGHTPVYKTAKAELTNILRTHPYLGKDNLVDVCDITEGFCMVRIVNVYGYVPMDKLVRDDEPIHIDVGDKVRFIGGKLYISAGGGKAVNVPSFDGTVKSILGGTFNYPYYILARAYDGWCRKEDLTKL